MFILTGGSLKNAKLQLPDQNLTRPTSSRAREGLFNILMHRYDTPFGSSLLTNALVLDLYAGSGSLGLEALSRGARFCFFCENNPKTVSFLRANIHHLKQEDRCMILSTSCLEIDSERWGRWERPDIIFIDPPYFKNLIPETLALPLIRRFYEEGSLIVTESHQKEVLPDHFSEFQLDDERSYGIAKFRFFKINQ